MRGPYSFRYRVLDLGSGSGRDCYAAAALVGEKGTVTGVDMTAKQLKVVRDHGASCRVILHRDSWLLEAKPEVHQR
jgi:ubiquinone/menaquinone biosynthesis C-methylase UbiE